MVPGRSLELEAEDSATKNSYKARGLEILVIGGKVCGISFHLHLKCLGVLGDDSRNKMPKSLKLMFQAGAFGRSKIALPW